jgi:3-hydroxyacyl-[acyl-carrier-protein] dehydratase
MPPELILDPEQVDLSRVLADRDGLRRVNPQRFEMEQLDAIVCMDPERQTIVGYKDVRADEFWARGHMPGFPLLPGVLMCEAAAQLVGYYVTVCGFKVGDYIGFAGMENVRFRGMVRPGDRLVLIGKGVRLHRRQTIFNVQGFVGKSMVFHADVIGVNLSRPGSPGGDEEG